MNSEEKLVQGLKLVIEAFAEMMREGINTPNMQSIDEANSINKTFKPKEAAEYLGVSEYRIRISAKQGKLKHFRTGNRYLFRKSDLDEWIKEETEKSVIKEKSDNQYGKIRKVTE